MKKTTALTIIIFLLSGLLFSSGLKEKDYQDVFNKWIKGKAEVVLSDRSRVDVLTDQYAIEIDFAIKWAESIGQSLFYALMTNRKPGIVLIIKAEKDHRYLKRLLLVTRQFNIKVWIINSDFKITAVK